MELTTTIGVTALINICISFTCIVFSWWLLQKVKLETWFRVKNSAHSRALQVLLAIALGGQVASFLIDYLQWSRMISQSFF